MLPRDIWSAAEQATINCDVFLVIGTSAQVYPAAGLIHLARSSGAKAVEVNTETTAASSEVDCTLMGAAGQILPRLITAE
jgi:NAD-dependent deacetylase